MQATGEHRANHGDSLPDDARAIGWASPFDRAGWFDLLHAMEFADCRRIDANGRSGQVAAWLPLVETAPRRIMGLSNWYSFSLRPLFTGNGDAGSRQEALADLARQLKHDADRLSLYPLPVHDGSHAAIASALKAAGWWVFATAAGDRHWLDLVGLDHDSWWASRPGALRNTIARKAKKNIVAIQLVDRFDAGFWQAYEAIYAASWKPREGNPELLRAFAEAEATGGRLRMGLARIDSEPVAAQVWTVEGGTAFIHKLAHVEDKVKASPGSLLTAALFRHVIVEDRVARVDFGTGNDAYKRDWMNRHEPLWRIEAFNPARFAAWGPASRAWVRRWLDRRHPPQGN